MTTSASDPQSFGVLNWLVLVGYLTVLVGIGWRCSRGSDIRVAADVRRLTLFRT